MNLANGSGISLGGTGGKVTIGHSNSITAGTAKGTDTSTLDFADSFNIPSITYDAQGHITEVGTTTITLPDAPTNSRDEGYGKITPANSTAVTALTGNTTQITAKNYNENVKFAAANKWIVLAGTNSSTAGSDEMKWGHILSGITAGSFGPEADVTGNNNSTIVIPQITVDAAGHVTAVESRTLTLKNTTYSVVSSSANGLAPKAATANSFLVRVGSATNPTWNSFTALDGGNASTTD